MATALELSLLDRQLDRDPRAARAVLARAREQLATIEAAAYFLVSEALTNVAKHPQADAVRVDITATDGTLAVTIADNGVGGADPANGSGLRGLVDRVTAVGGRLQVSSPPADGTRLCAHLPMSNARHTRRRLIQPRQRRRIRQRNSKEQPTFVRVLGDEGQP